MSSDARRYAIVTGAASGLGRALALRLAAGGWHLALSDLDVAGSEETLRLVEAAGGTGQVEPLDVTRIEQWQALRDRLRPAWPRLDLLINNAGVGSAGDVGVFPLDEWQFIINVNLYGGIHGCHTMVDWLKENPRGAHLVNVASFAGIAPSPSMAAYNVSKAGMIALSETLYGELRPHGVGVTVVCPLFFRTNIHRAARSYNPRLSEMMLDAMDKATITADDVADATLRAVRRKQLYAMPGRQARWAWWMRRWMPTGFLNGVASQAARWAAAEQTRS